MHWADHTASLLEARGEPCVIAAGITPSGEFHIGHLREILTGEMIHRAALDRGLDSRFVFIVDSMDPLRRVYDFLDPSYERWIGHPLYSIPAPSDDGRPNPGSGSYSDHFLLPFLDALSRIGVEPEVVMNHESYEDGLFAEAIRLSFENAAGIRTVIENRSGRELPEDWQPYSPIGSEGSLDGVTITSFEDPIVHWKDDSGATGFADIRRADGKLPWRLDWPARWGFLGITCEPFGKDHAAAGGSYDTAAPIAELFGHAAPQPLPYEWIVLKGAGAFSSSAGITIGPIEALDLVPPEIIRYLIARTKPARHIEFDTGSALIEMADEYERLVEKVASGEDTDGMSRRQRIAAEVDSAKIRLSQVNRTASVDVEMVGISFRHLALLAQIRSNDDRVWDSLRLSGHIGGNPSQSLEMRLARMRSWIASDHFPEEFRLTIVDEPSEAVLSELGADDREYLRRLRDTLSTVEWKGDSINDAICSIARQMERPLRGVFVLLYRMVLDCEYGPRLASILAEIGRERSVGLLRFEIEP